MKKYTLPDLPYSYDALEPAISKEIMKLHHDKHHQGYVDKANKAQEMLEKNDINFKHVYRDLSFNLNGHILHSNFWEIMQPYSEDNDPSDRVKEILSDSFESFESFKERFAMVAKSVEGSGWAALVKNADNDLQIIQIENHNKLFLSGFQIIMLLDVWEHAYYLDYMNDRGKYIDSWWKVVNWDEIESRLQNN
jgi:Fe-Mn family superoxide dismutase